MGHFIDGVWQTQDHFPTDQKGAFVRAASQFRRRLGSEQFPFEPGRYVLYVSHACPWCHRTTLVRSMRGLQDVIPLAVVDPLMTAEGWHFSDGPGCVPDPLYGLKYARELYVRADPGYTGRCTVPILWDSKTGTIVNNESSEIIRMMSRELAPWGDGGVDLATVDVLEESDAWRDRIYNTVNNGVYRSGFARSQEAYEGAVTELFSMLDTIEAHLDGRRFLCGEQLSEADICLFVTLLRFDPVYVGHFKCNLRRIVDYEQLNRYTQDILGLPGVAETCDLDHIKQHYYRSHRSINPSGIVPVGPL
jgi:glutathionyl-hydroquinone reductase